MEVHTSEQRGKWHTCGISPEQFSRDNRLYVPSQEQTSHMKWKQTQRLSHESKITFQHTILLFTSDFKLQNPAKPKQTSCSYIRAKSIPMWVWRINCFYSIELQNILKKDRLFLQMLEHEMNIFAALLSSLRLCLSGLVICSFLYNIPICQFSFHMHIKIQ